MTAKLAAGEQPDASHWTLADFDLSRIEHGKVRDDLVMYYLVTTACFIETAAELYTRNLIEHFPDPRAQEWLVNRWQQEELQHGRALRAYVETAWPMVDWERGYTGFFDEYSVLCTMDELEPSRALEMAARCVVETGTATFYTMLHDGAHEPVLKQLTGLIRQDEVRHYNYFRSFFHAYQRDERIGRLGVVRALHKRFTEVESEDAYIGFKHAWAIRHPGRSFRGDLSESFMVDVRKLMAVHYPYRMAMQMLLQPLAIRRSLQRLAMPLLERAARRLMFS